MAGASWMNVKKEIFTTLAYLQHNLCPQKNMHKSRTSAKQNVCFFSFFFFLPHCENQTTVRSDVGAMTLRACRKEEYLQVAEEKITLYIWIIFPVGLETWTLQSTCRQK